MSTAHPDAGEQEIRRRPGGRAAAVRTAVHTATVALLEEVGYDRLHLPEVAARAGVNKTTVYRRWPTKQDLVADLVGDLVHVGATTPDTGSLVGDLEHLLVDVAALLRRRVVTAVIRGLMDLGPGGDDEAARRARAEFWDRRFARSGVIVTRAVARGELPVGTDPRRYLERVFGPLYLRMLIVGEDLSDDDVRALAQVGF